MSRSISWYDIHAGELVKRYEAIDPARLHQWLDGLAPTAPSTVLDLGAGTGRDAAWLARQGHDVVAVEPSGGMRAEGQRRHPEPRIRWLDDRLPELGTLSRLNLTFDLVLLSAVWQHVPAGERDRAFRKVAELIKPGGLLAITLRHGPATHDRGVYQVSLDEIERLARTHGLAVEMAHRADDQQGRPEISWTYVALRLPDDGTGALPLLRHVILNDQKSATYKLGLLRALCRIADGSAGLVHETGDDTVKVPLGLVALCWLRLYLPLIRQDLPQTPTNVGASGLGFVGDGLLELLAHGTATDLRAGARFTGSRAAALHAAIRDAARTIDRMPATFMTYPAGGRILPVERQTHRRMPLEVTLNGAYLGAFGWMHVPTHLWRAMRRHAAWIEPTLVAEWTRLMRDYARRQDRTLPEEVMTGAMRWSDPEREVLLARERAVHALELGSELHCVWSERRVGRESLDIDHMFPWVAWPCGDLWNLLPAHREVNQRLKRDRIPSAAALARAEERIIGWWQSAYLDGDHHVLHGQFFEEARASLPALITPAVDEVFASVALQRVRLRHDQQVPEWDGSR